MIDGSTNFFNILQGAAAEMIAREEEAIVHGPAALKRIAQVPSFPWQRRCRPRPKIPDAPDHGNGARMREGKDPFSDGAQGRGHETADEANFR
jgi:hypothetical protein